MKNPATRQEVQINLILGAFRGDSGEGAAVDPPNWRRPEDVNYMYRPGSILVRDRDLNRLRGLFVDRPGQEHGGGIGGLTRYEPSPEWVFPDGFPDPGERTLRLLDFIDTQLGPGVCTPDHLISVCPVSPCPATEPEEIFPGVDPDPGVSRDRCDGRGVRVVVVDNAYEPEPLRPWLIGVDGDPEPATDPIAPYGGHGKFIAGVIRCMAPKAEVHVMGVLTRAGATYESELVPKLDEALQFSPDIISLSAGTRSRNELSLLGFDVFYEQRLRRRKGLLLVAAAGNDGDPQPFWPAASRGTVSVGALDENERDRAWFTNYGHWVDVYTRGENLVNAFLHGRYECKEPPNVGQQRFFDGMARWSGTSFSTPLVTGLIAARMSLTGENARRAADALLRFARTQAIPGVGAVLHPGQACADLEHRQHDCRCCHC